MSNQTLEAYREIMGELIGPAGPFNISQPDGIRTRKMAGTKNSILDLFDATLEIQPSPPMIEFDGERQTFRQVFSSASRLAETLVDRHGVEPGDRVGIVMRNRPEWFSAFLAVLKAGAIATLLNSRGSGAEIAESARDVGCSLILADDKCAARLAGLSDIPVCDTEQQTALISAAQTGTFDRRTRGDTPAIILFTSGTTGRPKGATLTHNNICCATRQLEYLGALGLALAARRNGVAVETLRQNVPKSVSLLIVPLFHISGLTTVITAALGGGMITGMRRWDPAQALDLIERNSVTALNGPTLIMEDLLALPDAKEKLQSIAGVVVAGQATPVGLSERISAALPRAALTAGWGMTEVSGAVSSASGGLFELQSASVGVPLPLVDLELRDEHGDAVATGDIGEIAIRGPVVMQGYWDRPEANAESFDGDWFLTGDLARLDEDGLIYIVDRAKDMIISAGENIYCAEVERVLSMVEHHAEVALFGIPDDRLGERAIAAVVLANDYLPSPEAHIVTEHVREHLADYKVPSEVVFDLGPFPRNSSGKIDKNALRAAYLKRHATKSQQTRNN